MARLAFSEGLPGDVAKGNLAAALGDLANAYLDLDAPDAMRSVIGTGDTDDRLGRDNGGDDDD